MAHEKAEPSSWGIWATLAALLLLSLAFFFLYVGLGDLEGCQKDSNVAPPEKTIEALDKIVELGTSFGTTLAGLGAAVLLGFKSGLELNRCTRALLMANTVVFVQSALYGVYWRLGVSQLWLNECLGSITDDYMQHRYLAHIFTFMFGLALLGFLVIIAAFRREKPKAEGRWSDV